MTEGTKIEKVIKPNSGDATKSYTKPPPEVIPPTQKPPPSPPPKPTQPKKTDK
jgi:hypothetical protein